MFVSLAFSQHTRVHHAQNLLSLKMLHESFCVLQSVVYGMLFAFGYQVMLRYKWIEDNHSQHLFSRPISWALCFLAFLGFGVRF